MFSLAYQQPENASGEVAAIYDFFRQKRSPVPAPLQLMSASPAMMQLFFKQIKYLASNERLSFQLLAAIRFFVAKEMGFPQCIDLNRLWLGKVGFSEDDLSCLAAGASVPALSAAENALLALVKKVVRRQEVKAEEVPALRELGWQDGDILDACVQGTNMIGLSHLFQAFHQPVA